ncbi:MAG: hypothetical protein JWP44_3853 [Mucilaginibacter sp.]|nr:hypothetical protein [Mucilaginibacter sp.]
MSLAYDLNVASTVSGFLPLLAALYNYKHLDKILKLAAAFFLLSALFDLILEVTKMAGHNNLPWIHLFIVISIVFFSAIYYYAIAMPVIKKAIVILAVAALILVIINAIFIEHLSEYPSISNTVLSILLIVFSLVYFFQLLNKQEFIHIDKLGLFWINAGVLIYFSINIFLFMLFRRIIEAHQQQEYYLIHIITNIIANVLYTIGLLCKPQKTA